MKPSINLSYLYTVQKHLDDLIIKEKGLEGQDLLDEKILALQVELGELANEWRGFKFWSEDQEPKTEYVCELCEGNEEISSETAFGTYEMGFDVYKVDVTCPVCLDVDKEKNPLLEEYVDCLHFILSIGSGLGISNFNFTDEGLPKELKNTTYHFNQIFLSIADVRVNVVLKNLVGIADEYCNMFNLFLLLSKHLGFTWEQIEQAYYEKNKINHERQKSGY